ncbi:acyl-CoA thioesterase [uncultured Desulfuromonas sp.]|uniref:acyl-CoA thioesterase n=1 Tax=uncultured Desulfuromonas sp. TaxID=181013 RepID=UPI00374DCBE0
MSPKLPKYGDRLRIRTTVSIPKPTRGIFNHLIENAETGQIICQARHYGLWMNRVKRRPHPFPDEVVMLLSSEGE